VAAAFSLAKSNAVPQSENGAAAADVKLALADPSDRPQDHDSDFCFLCRIDHRCHEVQHVKYNKLKAP
jgi:hypothetical protein